MWQSAFAWFKRTCLRSLTIAWAYLVAFVALLMQFIDATADFFNDSALKEQIHTLLGESKSWGYVLLFISVMTVMCRLRSIKKALAEQKASDQAHP